LHNPPLVPVFIFHKISQILMLVNILHAHKYICKYLPPVVRYPHRQRKRSILSLPAGEKPGGGGGPLLTEKVLAYQPIAEPVFQKSAKKGGLSDE
jgi:hypothetical protein